MGHFVGQDPCQGVGSVQLSEQAVVDEDVPARDSEGVYLVLPDYEETVVVGITSRRRDNLFSDVVDQFDHFRIGDEIEHPGGFLQEPSAELLFG